VHGIPASKAVDHGWCSTIDATDHLVGRHPVRWGIGDALVGLVLAQVAAMVGVVVVVAVAGGPDRGTSVLDDFSIGTLVVLQAFLWVGYGGWTVFAASRRGNGVVLDFGWRFTGADVYQGLLIGVAAQLLAVQAAFRFLFLIFGEWDVSESARNLTDLATGPADVVLLVLIVVVGAPVVEELFFRGLLLRSLERRWGSTVAIGVSSVVFAAVHLEPRLLAGHLIFGLLAGWLTVRSGRLGPAIWAHVGFNGVTVAALLALS
jgi:uncharacterized protein